MFGKKFCAALCTSLALSSAAPKADAVSGIAVFDFVLGGVKILSSGISTVVAVLGLSRWLGKNVVAMEDKCSVADVEQSRNEEVKNRVRVIDFIAVRGGFPLAAICFISGTEDVLNGVVAGDTKKNSQDVEKLNDDMKMVKEKLGITDSSKAKK